MMTRKLEITAFVALLAFGLFGCDSIKTPDGKVPSKYLDVAKVLVGTYQGQFNDVSGEISLQLEGDTPVLTYTDARGHDLLGPDCGSLIGKMTELGISSDDQVGSASFELDPGKCNIEGRAVNLDFAQSSDGITVNVAVLSGRHNVWVPGGNDCSSDAHGHTHCHHLPGQWVSVDKTIKGKFKKEN